MTKKMKEATSSQPHELRYQRFMRWSQRAKELYEAEDYDTAFILYWIAFNALYTSEEHVKANTPEPNQHRGFFVAIHDLDQKGLIYNKVWSMSTNAIRVLMQNEYIYEPFWEYQRTKGTMNEVHTNWHAEQKQQNRQAQRRLQERDGLPGVFQLIFERLYVLRNQLIHGSATYQGSVNREQVKSGAQILHSLLPEIGTVFKQHPEAQWGTPPYPPLRD